MSRPSMSLEEFEDTRRRILDAAGRLIASAGYTSLSMRRLGQEVGLSAAGLYRYFPTRQHVLVSYWSDGLSELTRRFKAACVAGAASTDQLRALLLTFAEFALEDRDRFRVLFIENDLGLFSRHGDIEAALESYGFFLTRVEAALDEGAFRQLPAHVAAQILWSAVHGALTLAFTIDGIEFGDVRNLADLAADNALRGLAASNVE